MDFTHSKAYKILNESPIMKPRWVFLDEMTKEEKTDHPEAKITGGYFGTQHDTDKNVDWWKSLTKEDRETILAIPNFDKAIFKEITGIDVDSDSTPEPSVEKACEVKFKQESLTFTESHFFD